MRRMSILQESGDVLMISKQYTIRDEVFYEMDEETHDHIYGTIYDGLVAGRINDNELVLDAMLCLADTFGVRAKRKPL